MFATPEIARLSLAERFQSPEIEAIIETLAPCLRFVPLPVQPLEVGASRIGGLPDLPQEQAWPAPSLPADIDAVILRGNAEANADMKRHIAQARPYVFLAQIDLAEAKALGPVSSELPPDGRLLFFYDLILGPYETADWTGRVIWDRSPKAALSARALPSSLQAASAEYRDILLQYGVEAQSPGSGTAFEGPGRAMRLEACLRPPDIAALEIDRHPKLQAALEAPGNSGGKPFRDRYLALFESHYYSAANRANHNQLLGSPLAEQQDPRFETGQPPADWRLLLQIDIADWMQEIAEGSVYFLIHASDLQARRFERVIAVYQQT